MQCAAPGVYRNAIDVLIKTIKNEGFLALYKGATPPAIGSAAIDSVLLGSLHNFRLLLFRNGMTESLPISGGERLTLTGHGVAGCFAGVTSAFVATPIELVKVKLQLQLQRSARDRPFKSPVDCARQIIQAQGITGLWTGLSGAMAVRSQFLWMFGFFELFMRGFSHLQGTPFELNTGTANFLSGGSASLIFWVFAIPADNIKNRMMSVALPPYLASARSIRNTRPSFFQVACRIHAEHGLAGFFRGLGLSCLRSFPMNGGALFVYEGIMRWLGAETVVAAS